MIWSIGGLLGLLLLGWLCQPYTILAQQLAVEFCKGGECVSFDPKHIRELVVRPTLQEMPMWSESAEELIMLTGAKESLLGKFLRQTGRKAGEYGPAFGWLQIERPTFEWLRKVFPQFLAGRQAEELVWDLKLSVIAARLKYRTIRAPLPAAGDLQALAEYWDKYYNANPVYGWPSEAIAKYKKYVLLEN